MSKKKLNSFVRSLCDLDIEKIMKIVRIFDPNYEDEYISPFSGAKRLNSEKMTYSQGCYSNWFHISGFNVDIIIMFDIDLHGMGHKIDVFEDKIKTGKIRCFGSVGTTSKCTHDDIEFAESLNNLLKDLGVVMPTAKELMQEYYRDI